jgi:hypothetical protein
MKLKPYRDYDEHNVTNLYATQEGDLPGGSFVQAVTFDPDNHSNYGATMPNLPPHAHASDYIVNARVKAAVAASGGTTGVIGMTLYDVKSVLPYPLNLPAYLSDPVRLAEQQVVPSGRAVPILLQGIVEISGFAGSPYFGAAAVISGTGNVGVAAAGTTPNVGTWLSSSGKDGAALLRVNCI